MDIVETLLFCKERSIQLLHLPREDPRIQAADVGSKSFDKDDWGVDTASFSVLQARFLPEGFSLDPFASPSNTRCRAEYQIERRNAKVQVVLKQDCRTSKKRRRGRLERRNTEVQDVLKQDCRTNRRRGQLKRRNAEVQVVLKQDCYLRGRLERRNAEVQVVLKQDCRTKIDAEVDKKAGLRNQHKIGAEASICNRLTEHFFK